MTLEQIDFFLMAVRCDTFLEAAENLHIAQSTLSKQIQKLETELNLPLFDRTRCRKPRSSPSSITRCCKKCIPSRKPRASRSALALFRF